MSEGYRCVCFPLHSQACEPEELLKCLGKLGLSPMWSRANKVEYNPVLGCLDRTGEVELTDCGNAIEMLQHENLEIVFHNEKEKVILRVGTAVVLEKGRFAAHWTSGRPEKKTLQDWLCKCEITMHDLCASFAKAVGSQSFSFESAESAMLSVAGEIDRDYFEDGSGDFKSYPLFFAGLPDESTDFFTDFAQRNLTVTQSYVTVETSIGVVHCLALGKGHVPGAEVILSDGMGKVIYADRETGTDEETGIAPRSLAKGDDG